MICMIIFGFNVYAQDKDPFFDKCIELQKILRSNKANLQNERDSLEHVVNKFSQRSFTALIDEDGLAEYLCKMSLSDIYSRRNEVVEKLEYLDGTDLAMRYKKLLKIMEHLDLPYNRDTNEEDIKGIVNLQVLDAHRDEFQALTVSVNDYRFVMFELGRVFRLIDRMSIGLSIEDVKKKLNDTEELEFIYGNIPYAVRILDYYILSRSAMDAFENYRKELYKACPEAFPQFKS